MSLEHSSSFYRKGFDSYFTEVNFQKRVFYIVLVLFVASVVVICLLEPFLTPTSCVEAIDSDLTFGNSLFKYNPCRYKRKYYLLFLTPDECSFSRKLVIAVVLGGFIGWERRQADRPAGIRTMALVSLGSCLFTINSAFAFLDGPMGWDASRISAAIPSGVGFLGAGLIFKQQEKDEESGDVQHVVHGLTTAAAIWLSAAVGVACGGSLYFAATFGTAVMLVLLRFGPRMQDQNDQDGEHEDENRDMDSKPLEADLGYGGVEEEHRRSERTDRRGSETSSLLPGPEGLQRAKNPSVRKRAHLASLV
uniref:MgtC/SapB/SrpB/YhiD N-terminal domain-containing protein n=1 Tax=Amphora coffeiformis TaxID=265554 RepID=A0A7S3L8G4_9STRA